MGAGMPYTNTAKKRTKPSAWPLLVVAVSIIIAFAVRSHVVFKKEEPSPALSPKEKAKLEQKIKEIDDAEQSP